MITQCRFLTGRASAIAPTLSPRMRL